MCLQKVRTLMSKKTAPWCRFIHPISFEKLLFCFFTARLHMHNLLKSAYCLPSKRATVARQESKQTATSKTSIRLIGAPN
jgi:hypothetical protein